MIMIKRPYVIRVNAENFYTNRSVALIDRHDTVQRFVPPDERGRPSTGSIVTDHIPGTDCFMERLP